MMNMYVRFKFATDTYGNWSNDIPNTRTQSFFDDCKRKMDGLVNFNFHCTTCVCAPKPSNSSNVDVDVCLLFSTFPSYSSSATSLSTVTIMLIMITAENIITCVFRVLFNELFFSFIMSFYVRIY